MQELSLLKTETEEASITDGFKNGYPKYLLSHSMHFSQMRDGSCHVATIQHIFIQIKYLVIGKIETVEIEIFVTSTVCPVVLSP